MELRDYLLPLLAAVLLVACSSDDDSLDSGVADSRATVTLLCAVSGLGDNGYNDDAAAGLFAFAEESGTTLRLLQPDDMAEARTMYRQWLSDNAEADSVVLVVGSTAYEQIVSEAPPTLTGEGSRVLLFESEAALEGVSTVMLNRYGASWLAGAMSQSFDALILAAAPGVSTLEESIAGFRDGHEAAGDGTRHVTLQYLAEGEEGFAMPDSAYHVLSARADNFWDYDEMIFPLLGGSVTGVVSCLNSDEFCTALMVGMDVDQGRQGSRIPFSLVVRIGDTLKQYLYDWRTGKDWSATRRLGLADGMVDITLTSNFWKNLIIYDERYDEEDTFLNLYNSYREEAIRKEAEYEIQ